MGIPQTPIFPNNFSNKFTPKKEKSKIGQNPTQKNYNQQDWSKEKRGLPDIGGSIQGPIEGGIGGNKVRVGNMDVIN